MRQSDETRATSSSTWIKDLLRRFGEQSPITIFVEGVAVASGLITLWVHLRHTETHHLGMLTLSAWAAGICITALVRWATDRPIGLTLLVVGGLGVTAAAIPTAQAADGHQAVAVWAAVAGAGWAPAIATVAARRARTVPRTALATVGLTLLALLGLFVVAEGTRVFAAALTGALDRDPGCEAGACPERRPPTPTTPPLAPPASAIEAPARETG